MKKICLILILMFGINSSADFIEDVELTISEKSCNMGYSKGCYKMAEMYYYGKKVRQDIDKSLKLYHKSCQDGYLPSCSQLGYMYMTGDKIKENIQRSIEYHMISCKGGKSNDCIVLGNLYSMGRAHNTGLAQKDMKKAKEYYGLGCDKGDKEGCQKFKEFNESGY